MIEEPYDSDVVLQILFIAGISSILEVVYNYKLLFYNILIAVKSATTRGQSAGVRSKSTSFEASQRLNTRDLTLAYLVGLIEGDGWFTVTKKGKYVLYELGIELSIRDVQLIYKIKELLGVGVVSFRERKGGHKKVVLRVRKKSHLIDVILPIFDKYPMLSNKQYDYLRFKDALLSGITHYEDLPEYSRPTSPLNSVESILSVPYFSAWLIGFIEAESCFSVYKLSRLREDSPCELVGGPLAKLVWSGSASLPNISYLEASFEVSQTNAEILIFAIRKYLSFTPKVTVDKTNNFRIKVTGVRSIENVIKFIQKAPVKLLGYKKLQYILWLKELRTISRYAEKFDIPNKY